MTILGGDYKPVQVENLDLVGYKGKGEFFILASFKKRGRELPEPQIDLMKGIPMCLKCKVENNLKINFACEPATLHDIDGEWYFRYVSGQLQKLPEFTFFEIGHTR